MLYRLAILALWSTSAVVGAAVAPFLDKHCVECHDAETKKGGLDLTHLSADLANPQTFARWLKVYDQIQQGEMPPKKKARPEAVAMQGYLKDLGAQLQTADGQRIATAGRAMQRRLNRYEYENALRDILQTPWLEIKDALPEDTEAYRFNKTGEALDVSHVQLARYISASTDAMKAVLEASAEKNPFVTRRFYARDQPSYASHMKFSQFNQSPERATFPTLEFKGQPDVRAAKAPMTVGKADPKTRELEGVGVVASAYEPIEPSFAQFHAPVSGRYHIKLCGHTVWVGASADPKKWFIPDLDNISKGRRSEPVTVYAETHPRILRRIGNIDLNPEVTVAELEVDLKQGETIRVDAVRFFRSRPGAGRFQNPLAEKDGQPGMVMRWIEVNAVPAPWPTLGYQAMFDQLPVKKSEGSGLKAEVVSQNPTQDAERLLGRFMQQAYRRPVLPAERNRFLPVIQGALKEGSPFAEAMIAGYAAVLCSPGFLYLEETPGRLNDYALAERLALFLWNSPPDAALEKLAAEGKLHQPAVLQAQVNRLLDDPRSQRFTTAFLDYWLELRKVGVTNPDENLYSDYYLDDHVIESAVDETRLYFNELLAKNLPARTVVDSNFIFANERLAALYNLPAVQGAQLRKVMLPAGSVRGGFLTQASVLKVTANGTTTSPVVRGAWMMERIFGRKPPAPPPSVPAIEPDIRGATTIRQQLESHRKQESCAACHAKIDPPGFALENFDVMGGYRKAYRAIDGTKPEVGIAKSGQKFKFHWALPVEADGVFDGKKFKDIVDFKKNAAADERQIARNLVQQFTVFATGAPIGFTDRAKVEAILDQTAAQHYPIRDLVHGVVASDLFLNK